MVSLPCRFQELFRGSIEWTVAEIFCDPGVVRGGREYLVALPAAERNGCNSKSASGFRLEDFELEPASAEVAPNGGRFFWDWYSPVVAW